MQKDEIWELKPEEGADEKKGEAGPGSGGDQAPQEKSEKKPGEGGGEQPEGSKEEAPKKEPDRIDMDEILDLKPDEESPAGKDEKAPAGEKEELELVDIGEKKPGSSPEEEGVVVSRQEEEKISIEKPQVLEPGSEKKEKGAAGPELAGGPVKKYERAPAVQESSAPPEKSKLLTIGLFVVFLFLGASAALLALPFFGIETIPEDIPVVGQLIEFYRGLPLFPE